MFCAKKLKAATVFRAFNSYTLLEVAQDLASEL
jgi:hypothetical protein